MATTDDAPDEYWTESMKDMALVIRAGLIRAGQPAELAVESARVAILALAEWGGGRMFYIPSAKHLNLAKRDAGIWREFNGKNVNELANKYGLSIPAIYRVLKRRKDILVDQGRNKNGGH